MIYRYYIHYKFTKKDGECVEGGRSIEMPKRIKSQGDIDSLCKALAMAHNCSANRMLICNFKLIGRALGIRTLFSSFNAYVQGLLVR